MHLCPMRIRVPKIRSVDDVEQALELIDENIEVHLSIETKEAWLNLGKLAIQSTDQSLLSWSLRPLCRPRTSPEFIYTR